MNIYGVVNVTLLTCTDQSFSVDYARYAIGVFKYVCSELIRFYYFSQF